MKHQYQIKFIISCMIMIIKDFTLTCMFDLMLVNFIYSRCFYMELTVRSCNILLEQEICKIIVFSNILVKYILCVSTTKNSSWYWKILFFFVLFFLEVKVPEILEVLRTSSGNKVYSSDVCVQDKWITNPNYPFVMIQCHVKRSTAQKMKFSTCGFGHIYWRNL